MIHRIIGRRLRVSTMVVNLSLLGLTLDCGGSSFGELLAVLRGRGRGRGRRAQRRGLLLMILLLLSAAGITSVMFHLRDVVLHVFRHFGHYPTGTNQYSNPRHSEGLFSFWGGNEEMIPCLLPLRGGGDDLWHVEVILTPWIPSRTRPWWTTTLWWSIHSEMSERVIFQIFK